MPFGTPNLPPARVYSFKVLLRQLADLQRIEKSANISIAEQVRRGIDLWIAQQKRRGK